MISHNFQFAGYFVYGIGQQKRQFELITQTAFGLVVLSYFVNNPKSVAGSFAQSNAVG